MDEITRFNSIWLHQPHDPIPRIIKDSIFRWAGSWWVCQDARDTHAIVRSLITGQALQEVWYDLAKATPASDCDLAELKDRGADIDKARTEHHHGYQDGDIVRLGNAVFFALRKRIGDSWEVSPLHDPRRTETIDLAATTLQPIRHVDEHELHCLARSGCMAAHWLQHKIRRRELDWRRGLPIR